MAPSAALSPAGVIREAAVPLLNSAGSYDPLLEWIGDASLVLLGEATRGTHEFAKARAEITKRLIVQRGFTAVAADADWEAARRVDRFVIGEGESDEAADALAGFRGFPAWEWRNAEVLDFAGWLRAHNEHRQPELRTEFYGLDLFRQRAAMEAALHFLGRVDPLAAARAKIHYASLEQSGHLEPFDNARGIELPERTERELVSSILASGFPYTEGNAFLTTQKARVMANEEFFYRSLFRGRTAFGNLRNRQIAETLDALCGHLRQRQTGKIVVWAHNSAVGDARANESGEPGELSLGQLVRERHAAEAVLIGFSTHAGTVTAASGWDQPAQRKRMPPAFPGSVEALFHQAELPRFLLNLRADDESTEILREPRLERAIGVVYEPENEREKHYFQARLADQFDAVIHFDESRALEPLERTAHW